jgi:hypothetical protein
MLINIIIFMNMKHEIGSTYFYDNFISEEEQGIIREWALRNEKYLMPNPTGPYRRRELFEKIPEKLELTNEIKKKIIEIENLKNNHFEPFRGDFLSIQRNGAKVPEHVDHNPPNQELHSRRYNVFVSLSEKGGLPIYGGEVINITERTLLRVESGVIPHSTTQVEGQIPRIILSYGFAVPN